MHTSVKHNERTSFTQIARTHIGNLQQTQLSFPAIDERSLITQFDCDLGVNFAQISLSPRIVEPSAIMPIL